MISQVVFDLPLDGPFDYLISEHLIPQIVVGMRVKVSFGPKTQIGFIIGLIEKSAIDKLKLILSLPDTSAVFNNYDFTFAKDFSAYYGCSLGEALGTMFRNKEKHAPSIHREHKPRFFLYRCQPDSYAVKIKNIIDGYSKHSRFLILVPDAFRAQTLSQQLHSLSIKIGTRSSVFECDGQYDCVIMIDEEDSSYKQEQTPMYETRHVLLMRSRMFGFDIAFVGIAPSVELMAMVRGNQVKLFDEPDRGFPFARLVDLSIYKFIPGLISPPVRDALEGSLKAGKKSILILNRRGSYRLTRCVDCAGILKCNHCDTPLIYSKLEGKYLCRHCTFTAPGEIACPKCHKTHWRSQGIGVEQIQSELKKIFPQAKTVAFERATKSKIAQFLPDFDILISTQAILRFQGKLQTQVAAFIDFDAEINRLDMRSAFNAFSLALHISSMAAEAVFIQTRNSNHYVLQSLTRDKIENFYNEELKLRKEFGFSPFKHWVKINWRGKSEKTTHQAALEAYNILTQEVQGNIPLEPAMTEVCDVEAIGPLGTVPLQVTPPLADSVGRKRDQFRFNVMVQTNDVPGAVAFIKITFQKIRRPSRVIVTLNVDP